jgi:hypothetical protein
MAVTETRANPLELTRLANQMLRSSQSIADAWRVAQFPLALPPGCLGDTAESARLHEAQQNTVDDNDVVLGRLIGVLEGDVDRLYRVAFAYHQADQNAAARTRVVRLGHPFWTDR